MSLGQGLPEGEEDSSVCEVNHIVYVCLVSTNLLIGYRALALTDRFIFLAHSGNFVTVKCFFFLNFNENMFKMSKKIEISYFLFNPIHRAFH